MPSCHLQSLLLEACKLAQIYPQSTLLKDETWAIEKKEIIFKSKNPPRLVQNTAVGKQNWETCR